MSTSPTQLNASVEVREQGFLVQEMLSDPDILSERPYAAELGKITARLAYDEMHPCHQQTPAEPDPLQAVDCDGVVFLGNATNVGMAAATVAKALGRGHKAAERAARKEFETLRMGRLTNVDN